MANQEAPKSGKTPKDAPKWVRPVYNPLENPHQPEAKFRPLTDDALTQKYTLRGLSPKSIESKPYAQIPPLTWPEGTPVETNSGTFSIEIPLEDAKFGIEINPNKQ